MRLLPKKDLLARVACVVALVAGTAIAGGKGENSAANPLRKGDQQVGDPSSSADEADSFEPTPAQPSSAAAGASSFGSAWRSERSFQPDFRSSEQVDIEVRYLAFGIAEIEKVILRDGSVTAEALMQLWKQDKGRLIGFGKVTTQLGEEATARATIEYIYPSEYFLAPQANPPMRPPITRPLHPH